MKIEQFKLRNINVLKGVVNFYSRLYHVDGPANFSFTSDRAAIIEQVENFGFRQMPSFMIQNPSDGEFGGQSLRLNFQLFSKGCASFHDDVDVVPGLVLDRFLSSGVDGCNSKKKNQNRIETNEQVNHQTNVHVYIAIECRNPRQASICRRCKAGPSHAPADSRSKQEEGYSCCR